MPGYLPILVSRLFHKLTVQKHGEMEFAAGSKLTVDGDAAFGGDVVLDAGAHLFRGATEIYPLSTLLAGGYAHIAYGTHETVSAEDTITTGLDEVLAVYVTLQDAPVAGCAFAAADVGDQAGAPAAGDFYLRTYKSDLDAADAFGKEVHWIAVGTFA